eukprot:4212000-Pyramimonas_sp.AAC.1
MPATTLRHVPRAFWCMRIQLERKKTYLCRKRSGKFERAVLQPIRFNFPRRSSPLRHMCFIGFSLVACVFIKPRPSCDVSATP